MRNNMMLICTGMVIGLLLAVTGSVLAGSLNPGADPTGAASQMYTLQQIYDRLNSGTAGDKMTAFTEPASGPGTATMHTLDEVMAKAPATDANGAGVADVVSGKTFWGLTAGAWGLKTGTAAAGGNVSGPDGSRTFSIPNGFYSGRTATANDADLVAGNIKSGVNIFGVDGTLNTYSAGVPKTGQTTSYYSADDGALEKGVAWPSPRFTDNGNNTVTDNLTGLVWTKNANLGYDCAGPDAGAWSWDTAFYGAGQCNSAVYGGYNDWRVPNVRELHSLISFGAANPALPAGHPFVNVQNNWYWTSTTVNWSTSNAWTLDMSSGLLGATASKSNTARIWLVRGGQ